MTEPKRILVIEDDPDISFELVDWLAENNYCVDAVSSGLEALDHLECKVYDVILMDGRLPDMDGEVLCWAYRQSGGRMPVLILTGRPAHEAKEIFLGAGANDFLEKPFDLDLLLERIEQNMALAS